MDNNVNSDYDTQEEIIDWRKEAAVLIKDVKSHVKGIYVSEKLPSSNLEIFLNVETLEEKKHCIRLSASGFQVAGDDFDKTDLSTNDPDDFFETPYSLLTKISPKFVESFAAELCKQLKNVAQ